MSDPMVLVPGRRGANTAVWWCMTKGATAYRPTVALEGAGEAARAEVHDLQHGPYLITLSGLPTGAEVTLRVTAGPHARAVTFRTWAKDPDVFRVAVGSCYLLGKDDGYVARNYANITASHPVDLRLLLGDQIYMDFDPRDGSSYAERGNEQPSDVEPFSRYRQQWSDPRFQAFMEATPTMVLADDHEFWNAYPAAFPFLYYAQHPDAQRTAGFQKAFDVFQSSLNASAKKANGGDLDAAAILSGAYRTTTVNAPLVSLFLLDARTRRERPRASARFVSDAELDRVEAWAMKLDRPGVLCIPQPLTDGGGVYFRFFTKVFDSSLVNYRRQYRRLWEILGRADLPHDVMVVSGDIHWNRLRAARAATGRTVYEYVSSGLTHDSESPDAPGPAGYEYEVNGAMPDGLGTFATAAGSSANWGAKIGTLEFRRRDDGGVDVEAVTWPLRDGGPTPRRNRFTLR